MLLILLGLFLVFILWSAIKPRRQPKPPVKQVKRQASLVEKIMGWFTRRKTPTQKAPRLELAWLFDKKTWADSLENNPSEPGRAELSVWLTGLSDAASTQLANDLAAFLSQMDLELSGLSSKNDEVGLKAALEELILLYSQAAWQGHNLQPLVTWQRWQAGPLQAENHNLSRRLFARLLSTGLATAPAELMLAPDIECERHVVQSIKSARVENDTAVLALLTEFVRADESLKALLSEPTKKTKKKSSVTRQAVREA
jgi:hypothetical protein